MAYPGCPGKEAVKWLLFLCGRLSSYLTAFCHLLTHLIYAFVSCCVCVVTSLSCISIALCVCLVNETEPVSIITGSIVRIASHRYLIYSEANFDIFCPAGVTRCTDGVKFGTEEGTEIPLRAKFHPHRCKTKEKERKSIYIASLGLGQGCRTPKLKLLLRFDQNVEYKRPTGAYPLQYFHKICRVCTSFQVVLGVKISLNC